MLGQVVLAPSLEIGSDDVFWGQLLTDSEAIWVRMRFKIFKTLLWVLALLGDVLPSRQPKEQQQKQQQQQLTDKLLYNINHDVNNNGCKDNETEVNNEEEGKILSRQKRNFGGSEPINFPLVYDSVLGVKGWLASGIEVFQDILFHLTGYTIIGK